MVTSGNAVLAYTIGVIGLMAALLTYLASRKKLLEAETTAQTAIAKLRETEIARGIADTTLQRAQMERDTAERRSLEAAASLKKTEIELAKAKNEISIAQARNLFQQVDCVGNHLCVELVCLPLYKTSQEAIAGLDRLKSSIEMMQGNPDRMAVRWTQSGLAQLIARTPDLYPEADRNAVYSKAIDCYTKLLTDIEIADIPEAIGHCRKWLHAPTSVRLEAACQLLPLLLNKAPDDPHLRSECQRLLTGWRTANDRAEKEALRTIIHSLERCRNCPPDKLMEILETAFQMAVGEWQTYGDAWRFVIVQGLRNYFTTLQKDAIAFRIANHISYQGTRLLESSRAGEYDGLVVVLTKIHDRPQRPRNRHVVSDDVPVEVTVDGASLPGILVNFSIAGGTSTPGAFVRLHQDPRMPRSEDWRDASLTILAPQRILIDECQMRGPEREQGHTFGVRIKFLNLNPVAVTQLSDLSQLYPWTR